MITVNGLTIKKEIKDANMFAMKQIVATVKDIIAFYLEQSKQQNTIQQNSKITPNLDWEIWCLFNYARTQSKFYCLLIQDDIEKVITAIKNKTETQYPAFDYPLQTTEHIKEVVSNLFTALQWYLEYTIRRYVGYANGDFSPANEYVKLLEAWKKDKSDIIERLTKYYTENFVPPAYATVPETTQQLEILNKLKDKGYLIDRYDEESNTHTLTTPEGTPVDASVIKSIAKDVAKADIYRQAANRKGIDFRQSRATADNLISGDFGLTGREINNTHNDVSKDSLKSSLERRKPIKIKHDLHFNPELLKRNYM